MLAGEQTDFVKDRFCMTSNNLIHFCFCKRKLLFAYQKLDGAIHWLISVDR